MSVRCVTGGVSVRCVNVCDCIRQVCDWRCDQVGGWLRSLGLAQYAARFAELAVDGGALLELTEQRLETELGVGQFSSSPVLPVSVPNMAC